MKSSLRKILENPYVLLIFALDPLINLSERTINVINKKEQMSQIFSNINWLATYDVVIRIALTILLWKLYKSYLAFKDKSEKREIMLNQKIHALRQITNNADGILADLYTDGRDKQSEALHNIATGFKKLGYVMNVKQEDAQVTKYKGKVNQKLDEQENPLLEVIFDDTLFEN